MFLLKSIQDKAIAEDENVAFVFLNVKGKDLLSIDVKAQYDTKTQNKIEAEYQDLGLKSEPFKNVKYFYPFDKNNEGTYGKDLLEEQLQCNKAKKYKFTYEQDKENLDLLFSNIDDPNQTMDSIINYIMSGQDNFNGYKVELTGIAELSNKVLEDNIVVFIIFCGNIVGKNIKYNT